MKQLKCFKRQNGLTLLIVIAVVFVFDACTKEKVNLSEEILDVSVSECDSLIAISDGWYSCQIVPIINASCATPSCHVTGGSGSGNFETYAGLKAKVDNGSFENRAILGQPGPMPYEGLLPDSVIAIFQAWIDKAAPNN